MLDNHSKETIKEFWDWIKQNKDYVDVQFYDETECWVYIAFDSDTLHSFTDEFQHLCEEYGQNCTINMNCISFKMKDLMGGHGFTMTDLWNNRPQEIEDTLGYYIY